MLRRLIVLDARERLLLAVSLGWVMAARVALAGTAGSLQRTQRTLDMLCARLPRSGAFTLDEAAWAITAAARRVPGTRCLAWALALHGMLRHEGIFSELRIGVAKTQPDALSAHAWVDCSGRVLSWGDRVDGYNVLHARAVES